MDFYPIQKMMSMKKVLFVFTAGFFLTACGDDIPEDAGRVGQGSMPADSTILRVNQGALGTDLGGSPKKPDTARRSTPAVAPPAAPDSAR